MTHNFLEELEIPRPPYRMARPVASLTASDEPPKPAAETDEETMRAYDEAKKAEQAKRDQEMAEFVEGAIERMTTPEAVDDSVSKAAEKDKARIDAVPTPDVAAKDAAKNQVDEVESWYKGKASEGRTAQEAAAEFKGEGKTLNSIQEEYESTEAALKRAEAAGNQKEVERLTKQAQEYSDVIEKQTNAAPATLPEKPAMDQKYQASSKEEVDARLNELRKGPSTYRKGVGPGWYDVKSGISIPDRSPEGRRMAEDALKAAQERLDQEESIDARRARDEARRILDQMSPAQPAPERAAKVPSPDETLPPTPITEVAPAAPEVGSETINVKPGEPIRTVREALGVQQPAEAPLSEGQLKQQKFEAKSPVEKKKQVTRDQTAALKENAAREAAEQAKPETPSAAEAAPATPEAPARVEAPSAPPEAAQEAPQIVRPRESGYLGSAVEWASKKTGAGAWLDTLLPRLKSVYHRQFAERRAWMQERALGSLNRAVENQKEYASRRETAGWPLKKFYAWRERAWAKAVAKREAIVNKHDLYRTRRIDRHNELQRQVSGRYERELAPYRGVKESLEREQKTVIQVIATLEERYTTALKALEAAEGRRSGLFGRRGKAAADRIRRCAKEIEQRINEQRKNLDRVNKPLAAASMKIEKYEAKQRGVAEVMKFSEMEKLKGASHAKAGPLPGRRSFASYTTETAAPEAGAEAGDRSTEQWTVADFLKEWNVGNNRIGSEQGFEDFVTQQRAQANETGPITLGRMFQFVDGYLKGAANAGSLAADKKFFLSTTKKPTS